MYRTLPNPLGEDEAELTWDYEYPTVLTSGATAATNNSPVAATKLLKSSLAEVENLQEQLNDLQADREHLLMEIVALGDDGKMEKLQNLVKKEQEERDRLKKRQLDLLAEVRELAATDDEDENLSERLLLLQKVEDVAKAILASLKSTSQIEEMQVAASKKKLSKMQAKMEQIEAMYGKLFGKKAQDFQQAMSFLYAREELLEETESELRMIDTNSEADHAAWQAFYRDLQGANQLANEYREKAKKECEELTARNNALEKEIRELREELLVWAQAKTADYPYVHVKDLNSSWRDGLALCALLRAYLPTRVPHGLSPAFKRRNFFVAFSTANSEGIPNDLDFAELIRGQTFNSRFVAFLVAIRAHFEGN